MAHLVFGEYKGDFNVGLFGIATDKYVFVPDETFDVEVLGVPAIYGSVAGTRLIGIFCVGNSHALLVPKNITDYEFEKVETQMKKIDKSIKVVRLNTIHNVLGNLICANDSGCLISPVLAENKEEIEALLKVPVVISNIMDFDIVGSVCRTTNKGFILNIYAEQEDYDFVKKALKVDGDIGSVNFGGPYVSGGILANSNGVIVGKNTSGPETARIDEALGFLE